MDEWVAHRTPDILLLQEVRAPDEVLHELLGDDWHIAHQASDLKGRAGVAVAARFPATAVRVGLGQAEPPVDTGRWRSEERRVGKECRAGERGARVGKSEARET